MLLCETLLTSERLSSVLLTSEVLMMGDSVEVWIVPQSNMPPSFWQKQSQTRLSVAKMPVHYQKLIFVKPNWDESVRSTSGNCDGVDEL